jgi:hypothetical protein
MIVVLTSTLASSTEDGFVVVDDTVEVNVSLTSLEVVFVSIVFVVVVVVVVDVDGIVVVVKIGGDVVKVGVTVDVSVVDVVVFVAIDVVVVVDGCEQDEAAPYEQPKLPMHNGQLRMRIQQQKTTTKQTTHTFCLKNNWKLDELRSCTIDCMTKNVNATNKQKKFGKLQTKRFVEETLAMLRKTNYFPTNAHTSSST